MKRDGEAHILGIQEDFREATFGLSFETIDCPGSCQGARKQDIVAVQLCVRGWAVAQLWRAEALGSIPTIAETGCSGAPGGGGSKIGNSRPSLAAQ